MDWNTFWGRSGYTETDWAEISWSEIDWDTVDRIFSPKRKVKNSYGGKFPHMIGSFYSEKNKTTVEYESLGENIAHNLFELDPKVVRYYVQPDGIDVPYQANDGTYKSWIHHPDVLVFRQGTCPHLFQIKNSSKETDKQSQKQDAIDRACSRYAFNYRWRYFKVYPKEISAAVLINIKFLSGFLKRRKEYKELDDHKIHYLLRDGDLTIMELIESCKENISSLELLPYIYHLIAKGVFYIDYTEPLNALSRISLYKGLKQDLHWDELFSTAEVKRNNLEIGE